MAIQKIRSVSTDEFTDPFGFRLVFHGTPTENLQSICENGLRADYPILHGQAYGYN